MYVNYVLSFFFQMKAFYFCAILILLIHGVLVHTHPHDLDEDHHDDDHEDRDDVDADLLQEDELHDESLDDESLDEESESPNLDDSVSQEQLLSILEELNLNTENIDLDEFFDENQDHEVIFSIFQALSCRFFSFKYFTNKRYYLDLSLMTLLLGLILSHTLNWVGVQGGCLIFEF